VFAAVCVAGYFGWQVGLILAFVLMHLMQNLWRPVLISRIDECSDPEMGATVLSVESQTRRLVTMLLAPLVGAAVDAVERHELGGEFWVIGALGVTVSTLALTGRRKATPPEETVGSKKEEAGSTLSSPGSGT
jgi:hypothetical protein